MTIYKNNEGSIIIDDIIEGYIFSRVYQGYTKQEAIARFKKEAKQQNYWTLQGLTRAYF